MQNLKKNKTGIAAMAAMIATAVIWGAGFIATQLTIDASFSVGITMFLRFGIAAAALMAVFNKKLFPLTKREIIYGAIAGLLLFWGFFLQAKGLERTTPSSNGFITSTNVIMVPFIAWILMKKRPKRKAFWASFLCMAGIFILTYRGGTIAFGTGEWLTLASAFLFACQIAFIGSVIYKSDTLKLTFLQMFFAFFFSIPEFILFELKHIPKANFWQGFPAIIYLGVCATAVCYLLQTYAQSKVSPSTASVVLSTEALWCALFSVLIGYDKLTVNIVLGGAVVMLSVIWIEASFSSRKDKKTFQAEQEGPA